MKYTWYPIDLLFCLQINCRFFFAGVLYLICVVSYLKINLGNIISYSITSYKYTSIFNAFHNYILDMFSTTEADVINVSYWTIQSHILLLYTDFTSKVAWLDNVDFDRFGGNAVTLMQFQYIRHVKGVIAMHVRFTNVPAISGVPPSILIVGSLMSTIKCKF